MMMETYQLVPVIQLVKVDNKTDKPRPLIPKPSPFDLFNTKMFVKRKEIPLARKPQNDMVSNVVEGKSNGGIHTLVKTKQQKDHRRCSKCKITKPASGFSKGQTQCKSCLLIYQQWKRYDRKRTKEENEDVKQLRKDFFAKRWIEMGITG